LRARFAALAPEKFCLLAFRLHGTKHGERRRHLSVLAVISAKMRSLVSHYDPVTKICLGLRECVADNDRSATPSLPDVGVLPIGNVERPEDADNQAQAHPPRGVKEGRVCHASDIGFGTGNPLLLN
jgi:hypothetical protein